MELTIGEMNPLRHHIRILSWELEGARLREIVKKMGQGKVLCFIQLFLYHILFGKNFIG